MKNRIILFLTISVLFLMPASSRAGLLMKKHTEVRNTALAQATTAIAGYQESAAYTDMAATIKTMQESASPSGTFLRMLYRGQISNIALLCGIAGFFFPLFSIIAVVFGFLGFSATKAARKKGVGVAAFILGIAAIIILSVSGNAALPLF
jgi:hypothetical protein